MQKRREVRSLPGGDSVKLTFCKSNLDSRAKTSFSFCIMNRTKWWVTYQTFDGRSPFIFLTWYTMIKQQPFYHFEERFQEIHQLTEIYWITSAFATIDADIRFAGSTEYSARAFRIALVWDHTTNSKQSWRSSESCNCSNDQSIKENKTYQSL